MKLTTSDGRNGRTYFIDNKEVSQDEYDRALAEQKAMLPQVGGGRPGDSLVAWSNPIYSDAAAVHPSQVNEAIEDAKKKGVPTDFTADGRPIFTSSRHFRKYCKAYGFVHKGY